MKTSTILLLILGGTVAVGGLYLVLRPAAPAAPAYPEGFTPYPATPAPPPPGDNLAAGIVAALGQVGTAVVGIVRDDRAADRERENRRAARTETLEDRAYCAEHPGGPGCPPAPQAAAGSGGPRAASGGAVSPRSTS